MIFDASYWQGEMGRLAKLLRRHSRQRRWTAASDASVEKCVMLGFYAIRKMLHSAHPPAHLKPPPKVHVTVFPRNTIKLSPLWKAEVSEAFDLTNPTIQRFDLEFVCDQIIHSFFFSLWLDTNRALRGVFVSSDKKKEQKVYRIDLSTILKLFEDIATCSPLTADFPWFYPDHNRVTM